MGDQADKETVREPTPHEAQTMTRTVQTALAAGLAALLGACVSHSGFARRVVLMDPVETAALLRPCSRPAPPPGDSVWRPSPDDLDALEARLAATRPANAAGPDRAALSASIRQYAGYRRDGARLIYGNILPDAPGADWRRRAMVVCDGGPAFFGVEYDVDRGVITHLASNTGW